MMYNSSFPRHNTMDDLYTTGFKQIATSLHQMGFDIDATSVELICKGEFLVVKYRWRELDSEEISENEVIKKSESRKQIIPTARGVFYQQRLTEIRAWISKLHVCFSVGFDYSSMLKIQQWFIWIAIALRAGMSNYIPQFSPNFHSGKWIWKYCLQNGVHFVQASFR